MARHSCRPMVGVCLCSSTGQQKEEAPPGFPLWQRPGLLCGQGTWVPTAADQTLGWEGCQGAFENKSAQLYEHCVVPHCFREKKKRGDRGGHVVLTEMQYSKSWQVPSTYWTATSVCCSSGPSDTEPDQRIWGQGEHSCQETALPRGKFGKCFGGSLVTATRSTTLHWAVYKKSPVYWLRPPRRCLE